MAFIAPIAGILGTVLSVAGGVIGAIGAEKTAQSQKQAADYNAKVNENNAITANNQAAVRATAAAAATKQKIAAVRAASLENGFSEDGSTGDIMDTVAKSGELDKLTAIYDGTVRSTGLRNSATLDKMQGDAALEAGNINAFSSIFGGFSKAFS